MRQATAQRMEKDVEETLRGVDWADIGVRLTGYALWKTRNLAWRLGRGELTLGARTPDDLAAEAILKVLSGERGWDPRRGALLPYLQGVVDSLLSHAAAAPDVSRTVYAEPPAALTAEADPAEERIERLRAALQREQQTALLAVMDAIAANCEPRPQALAAHLGTSVADVNNRLKRLRRLALRVAAGDHR
jgi:hypothetical protein